VNDAAAAVTETDGFASMSFVPSDLKPRQTSARLVLSTRSPLRRVAQTFLLPTPPG
jgi:hypothetical protein